MDAATMILLLAVAGAGLGGGWFTAWMWYSLTARRMQLLQNILQRGQVIGIVDDVSEDRVELVPLVPVRKGIYVSTQTAYPLIVFVPPSATPRWSLLFGKPVLYVLAFKLYGRATDPRLFSTFGIAKIGLQLPSFECSDNIFNCVDKLVDELYKYLGEKSSVTIPISPEVRLGIAYSIPKLIRNLVGVVGHLGSTIFQQMQETSQLALELTRYAQRYGQLRLLERRQWLTFLLMLLIIGGMLGLVFFMLGGMLPGLPH